MEFLGLSLELTHDDHGLVASTSLNFEGPLLNVSLYILVMELTADKTLNIKHSVGWVSGSLLLGSITDKYLLFSEGNVRGSSVKTLLVGDYVNLAVLKYTDAAMGGSNIDADGGHYCLSKLKLL